MKLHTDRTFRLLRNLSLLVSAAFASQCSPAATPAGPTRLLSELRVCSENLDRFGESGPSQRYSSSKHRKGRKRRKDPENQLRFLIARMTDARCDVVGLQEVAGRSRPEAADTARRLAEALSRATRRTFQSYVGESEDVAIRNGFLVASDAAEKIEFLSFGDEPLDRLARFGPVGSFLRAPVGVVLSVRSREQPELRRPVFVLNIHFKSRSFGFKDVQQFDYETLRMEMAETTRELFLRERRRLGNTSIAALVGDRNNDVGSATAEILSGVRVLNDFRAAGGCRLEKSLRPLCAPAGRTAVLTPLFELQRERDGGERIGGSYRYRGKEEILDEILIPPDLLKLVEDEKRRLRIGVQGEFSRGSDHKLTWVSFSL